MRLSAPDEYFQHQVALPHVMVGSSDPSWRERYWISMHDVERQDMMLTCGFGQYPNQDVQEAFVVLSHHDRQHNLRLARALAPHNDLLRVGPFSTRIVRPFDELALALDENPTGISFDLTWSARMEPVLENRHFEVSRSRVTYDAIRYVQLGRVSGHLRTSDGEIAVESHSWWSARDHSWGTRPLPRMEGEPPRERPPWRMLMFCPIQFDDFGMHFYLYEAEPGQPIHLSAEFAHPRGHGSETAPEDAIVAVDHDLHWIAGASTPTLSHGTIVLTTADRRKLTFEVTALPGRAYLRGGGYGGWNDWFQGHWKGNDSLEHDMWDLTDGTQLYRYGKASSDHLIEVTHNGQVGYGVIEYMVLPGYTKYADAIPPRH